MTCRTHVLKTVSPFFDDIVEGIKLFEIRLNDRDYQVGDILELHEFIPEYGYTEAMIRVEVLYILDQQPYVLEGYVCMSIRRI